MLSSNGARLVIDDYKSTLPRFYSALEVLDSLPTGPRIVVLGSIETVLAPRSEIYRAVAKRVVDVADEVIVARASGIRDYYGPALRQADPSSGRSTAIHYAKSSAEVTRLVSRIGRPGDIVLFKGRSNADFREVAESLCSTTPDPRRPTSHLIETGGDGFA